jgi:hypothetical protein
VVAGLVVLETTIATYQLLEHQIQEAAVAALINMVAVAALGL